jgi:hypothetical protein
MVEAAFGSSVFLRGPHHGDMDFSSTTSFCYYNPEFITALKEAIESALNNPIFKKATESVYHKHLKSMAHTFYDSYIYLNTDPELLNNLKDRYLTEMSSGQEIGSFLDSFSRTFADGQERNKNSNFYEAYTSPGFWLRRSIDGTDAQFINLLEAIIQAFEPDFSPIIIPYVIGKHENTSDVVVRVGLNKKLGGYVISVSPNGQHGLVVATQDQGITNWYGTSETVSNIKNHDWVGNQYKDWRPPTIQELELIYNAKDAIGGFDFDSYWSSTEWDQENGLLLNFTTGNREKSLKKYSMHGSIGVRAVRSF